MRKIIHWNAYPILRLLLPYVGGILSVVSGNCFSSMMLHVLFLIGLLWVIVAYFFEEKGYFGIGIMMFWYIIGQFSAWKYDDRNSPQHFSRFCKPDSLVALKGIVVDITEKLKYIRVTVQVKNVFNNERSLTTDGNLLLQLKKDSTHSIVRYGDELAFRAKVEAVPAPMNPYSFDYQRFLHYKNIHYQSFTELSKVQQLSRNRGHLLMQLAYDCRERCIQILRKYLATDEAFSVAAALILGYRDAVDADIATAYTDTGAMHLLAVSGMHIGLLYGALIFLFQFQMSGSRTWSYLRTSILFVSVWGFTLLTGAGASMLRAAAMFSLFYVGRALHRATDMYHIWAISAFALLLWNPYQLFDVGFQLSYLAVLGIVLYYYKIYKLLYFKSRILKYAWQTIAVSLAAQLTTLPISLYYFGQFPTYFWLSGLLAIPISTVALYLGIILLLTEPFFPYISPMIGHLLQIFINWMNGSIRLVQSLPAAVHSVHWVTGSVVFMLYGILICWTIAVQQRRLNWVIYGMFLTCVVAANYAFQAWSNYQYCGIIVYNSGKNTLIDILQEKKCHTFFSENCHRTTRARLSQKYHKVMNINSFTNCSLNESYKDTSIFYNKNSIYFRGIQIRVLDKFHKKVASLPNNWVAQYLLIVDNPKISMLDLKKQNDFKQIIFNTSNQKNNVLRWKQECQQLGIPYYDIGEKGAWMLKLSH
jgi:competence protein ComEC